MKCLLPLVIVALNSAVALAGGIATDPAYLACVATGCSSLSLNNHQLTGTIPSELGTLTGLTYLSVASNTLTGAMPSELGQLTKLHNLEMQVNSLAGKIPSELAALTGIDTLWAYKNLLIGSIPSSLAALTKMTELRVSTNNLTGKIPSEFARLAAVTQLKLNSNLLLTGTIPAALSALTAMRVGGLNVANTSVCGISPLPPLKTVPSPLPACAAKLRAEPATTTGDVPGANGFGVRALGAVALVVGVVGAALLATKPAWRSPLLQVRSDSEMLC